MEEQTQPELHLAKEDGKKKHRFTGWKIVLLLFSVPVLCLVSVVIFETFPRYIVIDFPPPNYREKYHENWETTSYTVQLPTFMPEYLSGREFIWRRETTVSLNPARGGYTRQNILTYLDEQFLKSGWERSDLYAPCRFYFPESKFLPLGEKGYLTYRPEGYAEMNSYRRGDFVCLAIWEDEDWGAYDVSFITVALSPLQTFFSISMHDTLYDDGKFFVFEPGAGM